MASPRSIDEIPVVLPELEYRLVASYVEGGLSKAGLIKVGDLVALVGNTSSAWGGITGTLANQTDLATALAGKRSTGVAIASSEVTLAAGQQWYTTTEKTRLAGMETGATADMTGAEIATALDGVLGGSAWRGGGDVQPLVIEDEGVSLGQPAALNFVGAGVTVTANGTDVDVAIPAAGAVGATGSVQFNAGANAMDGAAGVAIATPTNSIGLTEHVISAANMAFRATAPVTVAAGGVIEPDPRVAALQRFLIEGNCTLSAAQMPVAGDLASETALAVSVVVVNLSTANAVVTPVASPPNHWPALWATSVTIEPSKRALFTAIARKNVDGTVAYELIV